MFRINELFTSIQGEGSYTGTPAHFIRFQGCPVGCSFCDSKDTWNTSGGYAMSKEQMWEHIEFLSTTQPNVRHVVLTGGEPLYNNPHLDSVVECLVDDGYFVQIETSGCSNNSSFLAARHAVQATLQDHPQHRVHVTISPKAPFPDVSEYIPICVELFAGNFELKFPVQNVLDIDVRIPNFFIRYANELQRNRYKISLQPVDHGDAEKNAATAQLCVDNAIRNGWFVSVQTHKMLGVR